MTLNNGRAIRVLALASVDIYASKGATVDGNLCEQ